MSRNGRVLILAGTLKILYDLLLYNELVSIPPAEERS
jgi:hypothetical protein